MSKCPICDTENAPGLTVCDFCGAELPETKKCKACGAEIPKKAAYCPECRNLADVKPASDVGGAALGMSTYFVGLTSVGDDRQEVIKVIKDLCNCSFDEARAIIDGNGIVLNEVPKLEAEIAVSKLRGAGARATMGEIGADVGGTSLNNQRSSAARTYSSGSSSSSSLSARFVDTSTYGILAIISSIFLGWIGLIICLYGFFKTGNEDVKKKCKIGLFILAGLVVLGIIIGIIAGAAAASMANDYYY